MREVDRIRLRYPGRIPVLIFPENDYQPRLDKNKFLVPGELTVGNLMFVVRKRISVEKDKALLFFVTENGQPAIPSVDTIIASLYDNNKSTDGFLRIYYSFEKTFGGELI